MIINVIKHFNKITYHKWVVLKLCIKAGIPWRGLVHDLSKYSWIEFWEGVKYYNGTHSPIADCKEKEGYSKAWLHHKGRNKHHSAYWYDNLANEKTPLIPYKYTVEMICDTLAAGIVYNGKNWTKSTQLNYYLSKEKGKLLMNPKIEKVLETTYIQVAENGIDKTINKKNLRKIYDECTK